MSAAATRIYAVVQAVDLPAGTRFVIAGTPAQAKRHVADSCLAATIASQMDLVTGINAGIKVETAGETMANGEGDE